MTEFPERLVVVALERERIAAAGLLAGGLAYRLFFWLVPLGLVLAAVLSFWVDADRVAASDAARDFGMSGAGRPVCDERDPEQHHARWYFLVAGLALVVWFGSGVVRALFVAHYVAWGIRPQRFVGRSRRPRLLRDRLAADGRVRSTQLLREQLGDTRALADHRSSRVLSRVRAVGLGQAAAPEHSWRDLLPGAVLVALGTEAIHLAVVLYLAPKIGRSSELYGALGAATVILLWLYSSRD